MSKIVYNESDSVLIRRSLKLALSAIESMGVSSLSDDIKRLQRIVKSMEHIDEVPTESSAITEHRR